MSQIENLISTISESKNTEAKDIFDNIIAEKVFAYLEEYKQQIAKKLFEKKVEKETDDDESDEDDEDCSDSKKK